MKGLKINGEVSSSFRDPSGFLFYQDGLIYRQVNKSYREDYDRLMDSGLYKALVDDRLLIPHKETDKSYAKSDLVYKVIIPEEISFMSYPYEWSFSQLKEAALTTLRIQKRALQFGISLKDSSSYNIQFRKGRPILIDTLSFERYHKGRPWVAYRQFCQHFAAPLALMSHTDVRLSQLFRIYIDGIPLDLASALLPISSRFNFFILTHIFLHAKAQKHFGGKAVAKEKRMMGDLSLLGLIDSLEGGIRKLKWRTQDTEWADYYGDTNYSSGAFGHKKELVAEFIEKIKPRTVWDLGANVGVFGRVASDKGIETISFDIDPAAVEKNYLETIKKSESNILPLVLDLTNPSPDIGWENKERASLFKRGPADMALALALVHHLAISNNLPFEKIARFFSDISNAIIIEFIPKDDSQVQRLLSTREDIFNDYNREGFEGAFKRYFTIRKSVEIKDSKRILYLMAKGD